VYVAKQFEEKGKENIPVHQTEKGLERMECVIGISKLPHVSFGRTIG
jgi:hypothetical protein